MGDQFKEDKPMTVNTVKDILKQDYNTVKALKANPESNYAQIYKKMIKDNNKNSNKKK